LLGQSFLTGTPRIELPSLPRMTAAVLCVVDAESAALVHDESKPPTSHAAKLNWLRTEVIGANHGIISTAGLVVGVDGEVSGI